MGAQRDAGPARSSGTQLFPFVCLSFCAGRPSRDLRALLAGQPRPPSDNSSPVRVASLRPRGEKHLGRGIQGAFPFPEMRSSMVRPPLLLFALAILLSLGAEMVAPGLGSTVMTAGAILMILAALGGIAWLRLLPALARWLKGRSAPRPKGARRPASKPASKRTRSKARPAGKRTSRSKKPATSQAGDGKTPSRKSAPPRNANRATKAKKPPRQEKARKR